MPIIKHANPIKIYKILAKNNEKGSIAGRPGKEYLTEFVNANIVKNIILKKSKNILDIGCADCILLEKIEEKKYKNKLIGIVPTSNEIKKIKKILKARGKGTLLKKISIIRADITKTNFQKSFFDTITCNGVFNIPGYKLHNIKKFLEEIRRISKKNCELYIGELPDKNEFKNRTYNQSILLWLIWSFLNEEFHVFKKNFIYCFKCLFGKENFIIYPKHHFYLKPTEMKKLMNCYGFKLKKFYKHKTMVNNFKIVKSTTRWNYHFIKK